MSEYIVTGESLTAIADAIRAKTGGIEQIEWKENGMADSVNEVFEAGKKSEYDVFWDAYQDYGNRVAYNGAFYGPGWNAETFKPKYDITWREGISTFREINLKQSIESMDLELILKNQGIRLIVDKTSFSYDFYGANCLTIPEIDCRKAITMSHVFDNCKAQKISLMVSESTPYLDIFRTCYSLKELNISGTIGQNGFNVQDSSLLDKNSHIKVINCLSATATGLTITLSLSAVNNAFETSTGAADGSASDEWLALVATKPNWTISLV